METITCKLCSATSHLKLQTKEYIQHIKLFHAHQPDFKVTCGISGCQRTYTNFGTFRNHVYDVHSECTTEPIGVDSVNVISEDVDVGYTRNNDSSEDDFIAMTDGCDNHDEPCCSQDMLKRSAAMALLGLKEKFKLTQASLQGVIQSMTAVTQQNISTLKSEVVLNINIIVIVLSYVCVYYRFMEF